MTEGPKGTAAPEPIAQAQEDLWAPLTQPLRDVIETWTQIESFRVGESIIPVWGKPYIKGPYVFFDTDGGVFPRQALHIEAIHGFTYR